MRVSKFLNIFLVLILLGYLTYVASSAVFLSTPLFAKVAGMENKEQTYVEFKGAFSPFPGFLWVNQAKLFISDQNVSITIDMVDTKARFSLKPFLQKMVQVDALHIRDAKVNVGFKSLNESTEFQKKYVTTETMDLKKKAELVKEWTKSHLSLNFSSIQIDSISEIKSGLGDFRGNVSLTGGFLIQPKVHVEVYPTVLIFKSGEMKDQFSDVTGQVQVNIDRFRMIDAPGNAVFPYFNADVNIDAGMKSLKMLDLTLRNLPGYAFEGEPTHFSIRTKLVKGVLQQGSRVTTTPSVLSIHTPAITASGFGSVNWEVDAAKTSRLEVALKKVRIKENSDSTMAGSLDSLVIQGKLFGNELLNAFHGTLMNLKLKGVHWDVASASRNPNLQYKGIISGGGTLIGYSGDVSQFERDHALQSDLILKIDQLHFHTSFLADLNGTGNIEVKSLPINLSESVMQLPEVGVNLNLNIGKYGNVKTRANFVNLEHHYFPDSSWKGQLEWHLDHTTPFVDYLREKDKMSALLAVAARVDDLVIKLDCEVGDHYSWLHINQVTSNGIWSAFGSLTNQDDGLRGVFETKVSGLPIGIRVQPNHADVKFLPDAAWYDETPGQVTASGIQ